MKFLWWYFVKILVKSSLFFYSKRIRVTGKKNIPKKGAVLFMVNHPNGLIDPLIIAVNNPRVQHFLVQAAVFKSPLVKKFLSTLNLMPIYRIRDGVQQLGRNQEIFEKCFSIFDNQKALMIFPEGSHERKRTIRPLSKGFSRIVFGALERNPELKIHIVPVGLTYQNSSVYPANITLQYGPPILANDYYDVNNLNAETKRLKNVISRQLEELAVHIPNDENYQTTLTELNKENVDFTKVSEVNEMIRLGKISGRKRRVNLFGFLKYIIILNSIIPWLLWKFVDRKNDEIEFVDTFRYAISTVTFGLFYLLQTFLVTFFFDWKIGFSYLVASSILVLLYSKSHPTPAE
ncbi:MAG: 1-acyl-sn-glycerol-3-phosphate acyltransferase [Flavobacteriaceae bacterium]|nr:1-acyl-sn-glycerol-3-phosphate acyltransferase [Flavobacteriaceae bacterium]